MYYRVQDYGFSNIDKFSTASIITRLTTDVTNVQNAYQMCIRIAVRSPMMLISSLFMAISVNPKLSLVFLCAVPILGGGLYIIMTHAHPIFERVFKTYDKLNSVVNENLHGIRVVKSFVREEYEIEKFNKASDELCQDFTKVEKVLALNSPIMQACIQTTMLFLAYLSAKTICTQQQIISGLPTDMNVGDYSALITYGVQMLSGIMMISFIFVSFSMSIECARRVCEVLNTTSPIPSCKYPNAFPSKIVPSSNINFPFI